MADSALFKKFQKWQANKEAEYKAWEDSEWEKNKDEWTKLGYQRSDANNTWGSTWSYNPEEKKRDEGNLTIGNFNFLTDFSNITSFDPYMGLFNNGSNPLTFRTPAPETRVEETPSNNLPVAFKYRFKTVDAAGNRLGGTLYVADPSKYNVIDVSGNSDIEDEYGNTWAKVNDSDKYALLRLGKNYSGPLKVGALRNGKYEQRNVPVSYSNGYTGTMNKNQFVTFDKQGGTMNKVKYFQQGGNTPQQDIQKQVVALVQAAMSGDLKATQTVNQIMQAAQQGDQQAAQLAQMIQAVAQQMQGQAVSAKWGSKLQYIRSLKFAKGGKTCPVCEQQKVEMKKCGGKKANKHYFGGWL